MKKSIKIIMGICTCLVMGLVGIFIYDKPDSIPNFPLTSYSRITFFDEEFKYAKEMNQILSDLPKRERFVTNKPDYELVLYSDFLDSPRYLSFFLSEGFIYDGYYLDAWTDSMKDKKSSVYLLNQKKINGIQMLLSAKRNS